MEIQPASTTPTPPPHRQTLKDMLGSESPRNVLDARFDCYNSNFNSKSSSYYAYADTMSICTRFLDSQEHGDESQGYEDSSPTGGRRSFTGRWMSSGNRCFTVFRRLATFPSSRHSTSNSNRLLSFRTTMSFKLNKVSPLLSLGDHHSGDSSNSRNFNKWKQFRFSEIEAATSFFSQENVIGKGGYADVYKGRLPNGQLIAVKRIIRGGKDEQGVSFLTELGVLGHVCHPNTTALLGFCVDRGLFLVFEFFANGSLATMLHGPQVMQWSARFKVALGTARGLHYLHSNCRRRIIHRDIKASNILLGVDFEPQITDFGLAKWLPAEWSHHTVAVEGTFGYLAPEYFFHGIVDEKTDVFAFGVLLLELVTGLRPIDNTQKSLVMKVRPLLESGSFHQMVDSRLKGAYNVNQMQRTLLAARLCIRQSAISRPSMGDVLKLLVEDRPDMNLSAYSTSLWDKLHGGEEEFVTNFHSKELNSYKALAFGSCLSPELRAK